MTRREHRDEYDKLHRLIHSWNEKRVELFKISLPNEKCNFDGVMKFFYQYEEIDGQKVATKCIRVSSAAMVTDVIEILVQKFRPDLKMLPNLSSYSLYEIHDENGEKNVRKMDSTEKPLLEMMKWSRGDREGRFLLRNESSFSFFNHGQKKKLSPKKVKKSPKSPKERRKPKPRNRGDINGKFDEGGVYNEDKFADVLYENYPPSKFTRSITNPEIVKNLWNSTNDKRLRGSYQAIDELGSEENSVSIVTGSLLPEFPNKTILTTNNDTAAQIVRSTVEKFQIDVDPEDFCLVEVTNNCPTGMNRREGKMEKIERILSDEECPVKLHTRWILGDTVSHGSQQFQLRRRTSFNNHLKSPQPVLVDGRYRETSQLYLIDLSQTPPSTPSHMPKRYAIASFPVEIGSRAFLLNPDSSICLSSPSIAPKHCSISLTYRGTYVIEPYDVSTLIYVNDQIVKKPSPLQLESIIKLGEHNVFKFTNSNNQSLESQSCSNHHLVTEKVRDRLVNAYSNDNNLTPTYNSEKVIDDHLIVTKQPTHNRTISEHTLKDDTIGDQDEEENDYYNTTDDENSESITNIKTTRNVKKRHNSAPHSGNIQFLEETPESELAVLPASISFSPQNESILLQTLISEVNGSILEFKLAPAYCLYMIARHHLSSDYHPDSTRHHSLTHMIKQTCSCIKRTVKDSKSVAGALAFWLSNTSELLHFLRRDYRLCMFAHEYENTLTSIIHMAYKHFTEYIVCEIGMYLSAFLSESSEADKEDLVIFKKEGEFDHSKEPDVVPHGALTRYASLTSLYWLSVNPRIPRKPKATLGCILSSLKAAVSLLHQCRVNATLSIVIFNLLFRYISMRLFNRLIADSKSCTQSIGTKLVRRLNRLKVWAIKEGLNMPAEDHLTIIFQAGTFLQYPKTNPDDVHTIHHSCDRLNSSQITALLKNYEIAEGQGSVNGLLKEQLIALAAQNVDQVVISSGQDITLQEDPNLELPFLIPEQGYSCDTMRGLPVGLEEYLDHAMNLGLCQLHITKDSLGCWVPPRMTTSNQRESPLSTQASTQMSQTLPKNFLTNPYASLGDHDRPHSVLNLALSDLVEKLKIVTVKLRKANKTLGINICEGRVNIVDSHEELLIFIRSLSVDGPAKKNGGVDAGDQILKVDSTILKGFTKEMVIKLLSNSRNEVTLKLAKGAAEHYGLMSFPDTSPFTERKGQLITPQSYESSSHSIKAHRRQLRQQKLRQFSHQSDFQSPNYNGYDQTAQWIQEQRDRHYPRPTDYLKQAARPTQSLNSLIPEKNDRQLNHMRGYTNKNSFDSDLILKSTPTGSDTSDTASQLYPGNFDSRFNIVGMASKLHDPASATKSDISSYSMYSNHQISVDSQYTSGDVPASLSVQMSGLSDQSESQAYPSLVLEKLSMEVGCHTQNNTSSAGLTVSSVLEQLAQKSREEKEKSGLKKSEVKGLDVDELDLEKQRMKFLFYQQRNDKMKSTETLGTFDKLAPMDSNAKVSEWVNKDLDMLTEDDELLMDPEKLLHITNLQQKVDSLKKVISEQRKKYRELQFAKERVKQCLAEEEKKSQQARNFRQFTKIEDQTRWHKDQKKRMKDWEKLKREKTNELQRYECKERESRSRLKALEQHLGELKKQLQACDGSISRALSTTDEFGSSKLVNEIPERDWTGMTGPPRIMSTDSITTESSLMSGETPDIPKDLMSLGSDISIPGLNDYNISGARNSPFSNRSDSSSPVGPVSSYKGRYDYNPDIHGSMEMKSSLAQYHMLANSKLPLMRGHSVDQERRLRMLKEEHLYHISTCSMDNIPSYSNEERSLQLHQLRREAMQNLDAPKRLGLNSSEQYWSKSSTNVSHYKGSIDSSNAESSLSNTPDVIPEFLMKPIHQSSSAMNLPYQSEGTKSYMYGKHSRPSSGFGFSNPNAQSSVLSRGGLYPHSAASSTNNSTEFLNGRVNSREFLFEKPEKLVSKIHSYSSHGNVSNTNHQLTNHAFEIDPQQRNDASRPKHSKKITRQANSPSTHKYSHRRPDASLNGDDRSKYRSNTSSSHSNLLSVGKKVQRQHTEL